jgi:hypothetical protein
MSIFTGCCSLALTILAVFAVREYVLLRNCRQLIARHKARERLRMMVLYGTHNTTLNEKGL